MASEPRTRNIDPAYFSERFNTALSAENEAKFQKWMNYAKTVFDVDLSGDLESYDLRGFWLNGGHSDLAFMQRRGHAPDTYKKPNHPTFSDESIYHGYDAGDGQKWEGGTWIDEMTFQPSSAMLANTHPIDWYQDHMAKYGEGVSLRLMTKYKMPVGPLLSGLLGGKVK